MRRRKFNYSEIATLKRCPRKWKFIYVENLEPLKPSRALIFGQLVHNCLAEYYRGGDILKPLNTWWSEIVSSDLFVEEIEDFEKKKNELEIILTSYKSFAEENDDFTPVSVETKFVKRIGRSLSYLSGIIDLVARDKDGHLILVEHKTTSVSPDFNHIVLDDQIAYYNWALQEIFGERVLYILYNIILIKVLKTKPNNFFFREKIYRTEKELENVEAQLVSQSRLLREAYRGELNFRNPTKDCLWDCSFRELCILEMKGVPYYDLVKTQFKRREVEEENGSRGENS